jgi:acyl-CoA dehydrogenase-like protein
MAAADAADDVDRKSRFLSEAIDLLKDAMLLSCSLTTDLGGRSYGIAELAVIARALGGACSSAGMVFAMHHAQALSLARHAHEGQIARLTSRIAADESLLASATTEITTGGEVRWPPSFPVRQAPRAHYARNKLLGLLPLIISVVWRRESRRRSRSSGTRTLGSAKRKKVRAHLGRDPITAISGN